MSLLIFFLTCKNSIYIILICICSLYVKGRDTHQAEHYIRIPSVGYMIRGFFLLINFRVEYIKYHNIIIPHIHTSTLSSLLSKSKKSYADLNLFMFSCVYVCFKVCISNIYIKKGKNGKENERRETKFILFYIHIL